MDTQKRILEEAIRLYLKFGARRVTMDDIANSLAISKKTIYQYFKDKDEIVAMAIKGILVKEESEIEKLIGNAENAIEGFIRVSEYFRKIVRSINPTLLYDLEKYYPNAWAAYSEHQEHCHLTSLKNMLERGKKEGVFRKDIDVEVMALMRVNQVQLGFDQKVFPIHKFDLAEVQYQLIMHFMYGIATLEGAQQLHEYFSKAPWLNNQKN